MSKSLYSSSALDQERFRPALCVVYMWTTVVRHTFKTHVTTYLLKTYTVYLRDMGQQMTTQLEWCIPLP